MNIVVDDNDSKYSFQSYDGCGSSNIGYTVILTKRYGFDIILLFGR